MLEQTQISRRNRYTIEDQIEAVRQKMYGERRVIDILSSYDISESTFFVWQRKYKIEVLRRLSQNGLPLYLMKHKGEIEEIKDAENSALELELEVARLRTLVDGYELMLSLAKERLGIDVKKNFEEMSSDLKQIKNKKED